MASKKISELTAAGALSGVELVEVVKGGVNVQTTTQNLADLGAGGGAVDSVNGATGVVVLDAGDIAFTPVGTIAATDVQAAIAEVASEAGSSAWGSITGTLSSQTDLQSALDAKQNNLDSASASTAGGTITLDMNSLRQRLFVGSASFAAAKILALSNTTNALLFSFVFQVTNVAAVITMPADFIMADPFFDGDDWTPAVIGVYELGGTWNGTGWVVKIAGPFV